MMTKPDFVYTTYINATPQKVWDAITNPEFTRQYWGHDMVSDWKQGADWQLIDNANDAVKVVGRVIESNPPKKLVLSWAEPSDKADNSQVTFEIEAVDDMVRLNVIHDGFKMDSKLPGRISKGWPLVLSGLKSLLETGNPISLKGLGCDKQVSATA